ncbi:MAG: lipopolysaccharide biosynthesis protein [Candidatus Scalindua sp.]
MLVNKEQQVKNGFIYLLPVISSILPFIAIPIFTRILSKEDYGVLALAQVYAIFISGLANFGMTAAYDRNFFQYRHNRQETAQLLYSALLFVVLNFSLLAGLTFIFNETMSRLVIGSTEHVKLLFWACCAQFFSSISYYYLTYFKNSEMAHKFTFYTITSSLINLAISLILVAYLRIGVIGLVYAQLCTGIIVFSILTYKFMATLTPSLNKTVFFESLKISYPLTPRIFFGIISSQFDKYMVGHLASIGGAGIYSIGQRIAYSVFTFMTAIENVFSPQVYKRMFDLRDKGGESIGRYLTPFAYISIFAALLVALISEEVVFILIPVSYHGAIDIIIILSMYYGFLFFGKIIGIQLIFMRKTHITSILTMVSIGLNVGLNIPFILKWGAIGAAWATLLAGLISGLISFVISQHYYEIKWEYKKVGLIFSVFFVSAILIVYLRNLHVDYCYRIIFKTISVVYYVYIGIKMDIINIENILLVKNIFLRTKSKEMIS